MPIPYTLVFVQVAGKETLVGALSLKAKIKILKRTLNPQ